MKVSADNHATCVEHVWERDEQYQPLDGETASMCLRCGVVEFAPADRDVGLPLMQSSDEPGQHDQMGARQRS
jgi:hypothetical protein